MSVEIEDIEKVNYGDSFEARIKLEVKYIPPSKKSSVISIILSGLVYIYIVTIYFFLSL